MKPKKILITGSSGFIGYHVTETLLKNNFIVVGIDNHNNYYDPKLKKKRLNKLLKYKNFNFYKFDLKIKSKIFGLIKKYKPDIVLHFAAQAGVRYSFINPQQYIDSNITAFTNILESMKHLKLNNFIYASSSSVYGDCKKFPFIESLNLNPLNFYGQTKLLNEKMANIYEKNFNIKTIGLRFFTVYGPLGRPDMFIPKLLKKIKNNEEVELYNNGNHDRDFTYVEDIPIIILKIINKINIKQSNNIFNVCNGDKINITNLIKMIEKQTGLKAIIKHRPFQKGDMLKTHGNNKLLKNKFDVGKFTKFNIGLKKTIKSDF